MANNPLFVADLDTLKSRLRLSGVPSASVDTHAIIDECVLRTRLGFFRRLGKPRVDALLATSYVENPDTEDGILRALANTVEVNMVRAELMERLPVAFMDASGDLDKRWNEEAPFREKGVTAIHRQVNDLRNQIEEDMQMLAGEESLASESTIQVYGGVPDTDPPRPGDTLRNLSSPGRFLG